MTDHIFISLSCPSVIQKWQKMLQVQILGKNVKLSTFLHNKFMILNILRFIKFLSFIIKKRDLVQLSPMVAGEIFLKCDILKEKIKNA